MTIGFAQIAGCLLCAFAVACGARAAGPDTAVPETAENTQVLERSAQTVILLHGMGRGRASLWVLDTRLKHAGFTTLNFPYTNHSPTLDTLAKQLIDFIAEDVKSETYHIVAHSLGNLIVRSAFKLGYPPGLGRIVMLAPPNHPAELARALRDNPIYRWFTGESGQHLASDAFYDQLPAPAVTFGVIAGNRGRSVLLHGENDGVVTVESTRLTGMADWMVVPHAHTFIMNSRHVAELCIRFIEQGTFDGIAPEQTDFPPYEEEGPRTGESALSPSHTDAKQQ